VPCQSQVGNLHPGPVQFRYSDLGSCRLDRHSSLTVWIVKDAKETYRRYFAASYGPPRFFLYRGNWLVVAPVNAPKETIQTIRESFGAHG
jgi:hypothetical protein